MAADNYSDTLGWVNQGTGNNNNSWGDVCDNSIFPIFEKAIAGLSVRSITGGALDLSGDAPPAGPTKALEMIQAFTGTLASDQTVTVPNLSKVWLVYNGTSGAFALKFKTPDGNATPIPQGGWCFVFCDGGDTIYPGLSTTLRDTQWLGADGVIGAPGLSFSAESTMGLRRVSAGVMALTIGGVDILTLSGSAVNFASSVSSNLVPPGTEANFAGIRAPSGWYFEYGQNVLRSGDAALMAAITEGFTANTNGTTTLSNVSKDLRNLGLEGSVLEGTGIFTGATIVSIDSATQITMSNAATNTATGGAVTAFPYGNGDGSTTFTLPEARGTVAAGRDNMGGTAAGKLTTAGSGVDGTRLKTLGGAQVVTLDLAQIPSHSHANTLNDPGHYHVDSSNPFRTGLYAIGSGGPPTTYANNTGSQLTWNTVPASTGVTITNASAGGGDAHGNVQPTRIRNVIIKR